LRALPPLLPEKDGVCPACINRNKTMLRIASYLGPYKWQAVGLATLSMITTLINLAPPYIQGTIIDEVIEPRRDLPRLWLLLSAWLGVLVINSGLQIVSGRLTVFWRPTSRRIFAPAFTAPLSS
jgi:ATP-binding cassette subfamily B protein